MHMALVCQVSFSCIGILTADRKRARNRSESWERIYVIKAIETWSLVNQSQEYKYYNDEKKSIWDIGQNFIVYVVSIVMSSLIGPTRALLQVTTTERYQPSNFGRSCQIRKLAPQCKFEPLRYRFQWYTTFPQLKKQYPTLAPSPGLPLSQRIFGAFRSSSQQ